MAKCNFICFFFIALVSCGGGGGGDGTAETGSVQPETEPILTIDNASQVAGAVFQTLLGGEVALNVGSEPPDAQSQRIQSQRMQISTSSITILKPPLRNIIDKVISISKIERLKAEYIQKGTIPPTTVDCSDGGTITISATWTGPDNPVDESQIVDLQANITCNSCKEGTITMDGTATFKFSGPLDKPSSFTFSTPNFTYIDTAENDDWTMSNLNMVVTELTFSGDELTGCTITITGAMNGISDGDPVNVEYDSFKIVINSDETGGTFSLSGRVRPSCLDGWVNCTTNTPIFIPTAADCPINGEIIVTSGEDNTRIVIGSDSTITIYFNGTWVKTYNDCNEVEGLCVDVTGTWEGTYSTSLIPFAQTTFTLTQSGSNVTGTYSTSTGVGGEATGSFSGRINENTITFTLNQTTPECPGTFSGIATVTGNTMNFTFTGSDCMGYHADGRGSATRL